MIKKKMSLLLAAVLVASGVGMVKPASAAVAVPKVTYVAPAITMAEVGDEFSFALQSDYAGKVQYQIWAQNTATGTWYSLTNGYTEAVNGTTPFIPKAINTLPQGSYKASVWVKVDGSTAKYDSYATASFKIQKDGYFAGRAKMDNLGLKDTYNVGDAITITGADQYKLHVFDPSVAERAKGWTTDATYETAEATADDYTFTKAGTYLIDVWGKTASSTNKYDGWTLKVVTVTAKDTQGIAVETTVKAATVGSSVTVKSAYPGAASYQVFNGATQVTGVAALGAATTMYPANKEGQEYTVKLLDAQGAVVKTASVVLGKTVMVDAPVVKEVSVTATFKAATVGSSLTVTTDLKDAAKFQVFRGTTPITGKATLGAATTAYPAAKDGEEVTVKLLDAQDNVLQTVEKVKLVEAK